MKRLWVLEIFVCVSLLIGGYGHVVAAEKVAWFKSGSTSGFWPVVEKILKATANDLELELDIYEFKNDPIYLIQLVQEVLADPDKKPSCVLIHNYKRRGEKVLELAEEHGVDVFIFNAGFPPSSKVGKPRGNYPHWIGLMVPDDEFAGYLLAKKLIEMAEDTSREDSSKINMVALEGNRTSDASNKRVAGLKKALVEHPEVIVKQYFHSKWRSDLAKKAFLATQRRYPDTTLFWTASESMALGVIEEAKKQNRVAGIDFVTGGVDLLPDNKSYIESGEMGVSVGGHYFEGAWALVLIHDYLHGVDFAGGEGTIFTTKMISQTREDLTQLQDIYSKLTTESLATLNFRTFSKVHNPKVKRYNFSIESLLKSTPTP